MRSPLARVAFPIVTTLAGATLLPCSAAAQAPDPFAAAQRWNRAASSSDAWLPQALTFAARGELVWHAASGAGPRLELLDTQPFVAQLAPRFAHPRPGALGAFTVASGADASSLYALAQYPGPSSTARWNEVSRYDALASTPQLPVWSRILPSPGNGIARLHAARSSRALVATVYDQGAQRIEACWLSGDDGAITFTYAASAGTLRAVAAARDLQRIAVTTGAQARIIIRDGGLEHVEGLSGATNALALSGDGSCFAVGDGDAVRVLRLSAGAWLATHEFRSAANEVATRLALSDDGRWLAVGWWDAVDVRRVRFQVWETDQTAARYERVLHSTTVNLQNFPEAVAITPDGRRAAFGAWGTQDAQPEALLVDVATGQELFALDLPGSVRALALDESGTRLAVGFKHAHANLLASTGEVRTYDTGERDLQLLEPPSPGGQLRVAGRRSGALRVYFLHGPLTPSPIPFGGASGGLWIERKFAKVFARPADRQGRADLALPIPAAGFGLELALQAYFRGSGSAAFSQQVVLPVVR